MSGCYFKGFFLIQGFAVVALLISGFVGTVDARSESKEGAALSELKVVEHLKKYDGGYSDLFVKLKKHEDFQRLSRRYRVDDPALWPTLQKRFVLKLADLQGAFKQAESMMEVKDRRGGLSNQVVSAERTRKEGRRRHDQLVRQATELREMLRLIDEMESVLQNVSREHALTDKMTLENKQKQTFPGQVLLIDGKDLIVKREDGGYFRVPAELLSGDTKITVINQALAPWEGLPGQELELELEPEETVELIAYDDSKLYVAHSPEGVVALTRPDDELIFVSYAAQLEAARVALAESDRGEKEEMEAMVSDLDAGLSLNQSRVTEIQWYESRLGTQVPQSEQIELKSESEESPPSETEAGP